MQAHAVLALASLSCFFWNAASVLHRTLPLANLGGVASVLLLGLANLLTLTHEYWMDEGLVLFGTLGLWLLDPPYQALGWVLLHWPGGRHLRTALGTLCLLAPWYLKLHSHGRVALHYVAWFTACLSVVGD